MKITEELILEKFGLKIGDVVCFDDDNEKKFFEILEQGSGIAFVNCHADFRYNFSLLEVISRGFEFKKVNINGIWGNARCRTHIKCSECPLRMLACYSGQKRYLDEKTDNKHLKDIYSTMKKYLKDDCKIEDDEINDFIEKRLNERIQNQELREIVEQSVEE